MEENDELQDKLLSLKSNYMENAQRGLQSPASASTVLGAFERDKMQQAIDELGERCRTLRDENKKLDAENNFFHMSTTIFIKLKPVMETEKQLCYQLAELNKQSGEADYDFRRQKLEAGITKCRDTISVMEVKLKKVLDRVKQHGGAHANASPTKSRLPRMEVSKKGPEVS